MTRLVFHHDHKLLPKADGDLLPVQLYGLSGQWKKGVSVIGNPVVDKIKRLGIQVSDQAIDFLSIALAVTAADTFVRRSEADDGWTRQLIIQLPLHKPNNWHPIKNQLERALHFLSGDIWDFEFGDGGYSPPTPYVRRDRFHLVELRGLDSACLFSGGLDSAIGAIDLLEQGRAPLLVSHAYRGDKSHQDSIANLLAGRYSRFEANPHPLSGNCATDITMRTRSINFLALGAIGANAVQVVSQQNTVDLIVPENGFISLNAPLTSRRIGSLSTRTTHPHFIESIQEIFDAVGMPCMIRNPYQFKTKGEMVVECQNSELLEAIAGHTVSCSHWKRANQQCGVCVPCIIRRAALHAGGLGEPKEYVFEDVSDVLDEVHRKDDLLALLIAIGQKATRRVGPWIANSGPLPTGKLKDFEALFLSGLEEVEEFLKFEGVM